MRGTNWVKFVVVFVLFAILAVMTFTGLNVANIKGLDGMNKGIDIKGGVSAMLEPKDLDREPTSDELNAVKALIEKRLDSENIFDRFVSVDNTNHRVLVEISWPAEEKTFDANALIQKTIAVSKLTFNKVKYATDEEDKAYKEKQAAMTKKNYNANKYKNVKDVFYSDETNQGYIKVGDAIMEGKNVTNASVSLDDKTQKPVVSLKFDDVGRKNFAQATGEIAPSSTSNQYLGIFMDETVISAPTVEQKLDGDGCIIQFGNADVTREEVAQLAERISTGNLPFSIQAVEINSISATLGSSAFNVTLYAMFFALLLVAIYMIILYRLPGIVAAIALIGHTAISLLFITNAGITVTLPGMAGIILSIGMAVDANVIIFERIKEEMRQGKTVRASVDAGFKRAFAAVFDGNITTLITGFVLYYYGTGAIKSFAITLIVGVILSFATAMTASRLMLQGLSDFDVVKKPGLFGVKKKSNKGAETI